MNKIALTKRGNDWRNGFAMSPIQGRMKIIGANGNVLYDGSEEMFYKEISKGRIVVKLDTRSGC